MPSIRRRRPMLCAAVTTRFFVACAHDMDQPKGTSKGYTSARLNAAVSESLAAFVR